MTDLEQGGMLPLTIEAISQNFRSTVKGVYGFMSHRGTGDVEGHGRRHQGFGCVFCRFFFVFVHLVEEVVLDYLVRG